MQISWLVVLPPIIVIACSWITHRPLISLLAGIFASSYIACNFSPSQSLTLVAQRMLNEATCINNLLMFLFLLLLGIITEMIGRSGGAKAFGSLLTKKIRTARSAETSTFFMSFLFMFDDYFNALTTASIMKPVTDKLKVSRAKLAFIIDATSAPLSVIMPLSSWIAALARELSQSGITENLSEKPVFLADPFAVYMKSIPFVFYSFLMIVATFFIVRRRISFGAMKDNEQAAITTKDESANYKREYNHKPITLLSFFAPIAILLFTTFISLMVTGQFSLFGGSNGFLMALRNANIWISLPIGGTLGLITSIVLTKFNSNKPLKDIHHGFVGGFKLIYPAMLLLFLAWTFSSLLRHDLETGKFLAQALVGSIGPVMLPVMFFLAAILTSFTTGSAWSTFSICVPIAMPMIVAFMNLKTPADPSAAWLLFPTIGAILSGGVAGDHTSPISGTTTMSSISAGIKNIVHVRTQIPYAIPPIIFTAIALILSTALSKHGYVISFVIPFILSAILCLITLQIIEMVSKRRSKKTT